VRRVIVCIVRAVARNAAGSSSKNDRIQQLLAGDGTAITVPQNLVESGINDNPTPINEDLRYNVFRDGMGAGSGQMWWRGLCRELLDLRRRES
jgi:hypothetical protein